MTKMEAVRRALAALGKGARPTQIQGFARERFGLEMGTDLISTYKGEILRKKARQSKAQTAAPQPPPPVKAKAAGIGLDDIRAAKELVARVGADSLRALIDLLSP